MDSAPAVIPQLKVFLVFVLYNNCAYNTSSWSFKVSNMHGKVKWMLNVAVPVSITGILCVVSVFTNQKEPEPA